MGPVADSLTLRPAALALETVQKKSEKELLTMIRDGSRDLDALLEGRSKQRIRNVLAYP